MKIRWIGTPSLALAALMVGCGASAPSTEQISAPQAAMEAARALGAEEIPSARLHLKMAQDQYQAAKQMLDDDDNERATWMLRRAEADADLAREIARMESTRKAAEVAKQQIDELQQRTR